MADLAVMQCLFVAFCTLLATPLVSASPPIKAVPVVQVQQPPPGEAFHQDDNFNKASYGNYLTSTFKSSSVRAPRLNIMKSFTACDDGSYLFLTPRGEAVEHKTATIYDASGNLIWMPTEDYGEIYNFQVQRFKGQDYITFWAGDNSGGHGDGYYYMFDKHYNLTHKINAVNGLSADLHSFSILPDDTVLLSVYEKVVANLTTVASAPSSRRPGRQRYMWDCLFQVFDLETGELHFQWRASDHFKLSESYISTGTATSQEPWDWFHINQVEKDAAGNYLISARHLRCVAYISGETGEVIWKLGGKENMFQDLSDGQATVFVGQHDAHWDGLGRFVTLFDNRADWEFEMEHVSKGKRIEIDTVNMTARLDTAFIHPEKIFAFSQGSYQTLPNHHVLLGYGFTGAVTEFFPNGSVACDAYLQPSGRFSSGEVQSYRNLKFNWSGIPHDAPSLVLEDGQLYVSWLGSTEVRSWWLQDAHDPEANFAAAGEFDKMGFETSLPIGDCLLRRYVRVVALDERQRRLRSSQVIDVGELASVFVPVPDSEAVQATDAEEEEVMRLEQRFHDLGALLGYTVVVVVALLLVFIVTVRPRMMRRWLTSGHQEEHGEWKMTKASTRTAPIWQRLRSMRPSRQTLASYHLLPQRVEEPDGEQRWSSLDDR